MIQQTSIFELATCVDCSTAVPQRSGRGRPRLRCDECSHRRTREQATIYAAGARVCAQCNGPVPPRLQYCDSCRAPKAAPLTQRHCSKCKRAYQPVHPLQRYCSWACRPTSTRFRTIPDRGRTRTGGRYDANHSRARKAAAQRHRPTDPCTRCHQPLGPMGPHLHYDHSDDGRTYLGFAHATCNRKAGAQRGNTISRTRQHR